MALTLAEKKEITTSVSSVAANAISVVVADYRGLSVKQLTQLRADARNAGIHIRVVKNTLSRRALAETPFACLDEALKGPVFLAFSTQAPGDAARLLRSFSKENKQLEVKALALGDALLGPNELNAVADLPTYDEAVAQLMSVMLAPITKLVRTLVEPVAQVVRVMDVVKNKK